uniref:Solute carrier family 13 member 2 n=1 Tax=Macrostomum lignano TaxID=282301 RepID=A0A1I8FMV2_9PLAT
SCCRDMAQQKKTYKEVDRKRPDASALDVGQQLPWHHFPSGRDCPEAWPAPAPRRGEWPRRSSRQEKRDKENFKKKKKEYAAANHKPDFLWYASGSRDYNYTAECIQLRKNETIAAPPFAPVRQTPARPVRQWVAEAARRATSLWLASSAAGGAAEDRGEGGGFTRFYAACRCWARGQHVKVHSAQRTPKIPRLLSFEADNCAASSVHSARSYVCPVRCPGAIQGHRVRLVPGVSGFFLNTTSNPDRGLALLANSVSDDKERGQGQRPGFWAGSPMGKWLLFAVVSLSSQNLHWTCRCPASIPTTQTSALAPRSASRASIRRLMYQFVSKEAAFLLLAGLALLDGVLQLLVLKPGVRREAQGRRPLKNLLRDPYILLAAGSITFGNMGIAMLEPSLPIWMKDTMRAQKWEQGVAFLPCSISYLIGTTCLARSPSGLAGERARLFLGQCNRVRLGACRRKQRNGQDYLRLPPLTMEPTGWLSAGLGMVIMGVCLIIIPFANSLATWWCQTFGLGFAIGMVDSSMMPLMGYLVDLRHVSVYGSVYAIATSPSASALRSAGSERQHRQEMGFRWMMWSIAIIAFIYAPLHYFLRDPPARMEDRGLVMGARSPPSTRRNNIDNKVPPPVPPPPVLSGGNAFSAEADQQFPVEWEKCEPGPCPPLAALNFRSTGDFTWLDLT